LNVPTAVENAARKGITAIASRAPDGVHWWKSALTDSGFLLTAESGLRYLLPILCRCKTALSRHVQACKAQMIPLDLHPYLTFLFAAVLFWSERGQELKAAFFATRLVSVVNENPDARLGWYDAEKVQEALNVIERREQIKASAEIAARLLDAGSYDSEPDPNSTACRVPMRITLS